MTNWKLFWEILGVEIALWGCAVYKSQVTGWLTQSQLRAQGITGYSFMEDGGIWACLVIIVSLIAYVVSTHTLPYFSQEGFIVLVLAVAIAVIAAGVYEKAGIMGASTHDHKTTLTGWIVWLFVVSGFWVLGLFYLNAPHIASSRAELLVMSVFLTVFFAVGVVNFSRRWTPSPAAKWQVAGELAFLWTVTLIQTCRIPGK